jgi:4-diphosphocytidyl-2C-methyl-D-erythritol kinase
VFSGLFREIYGWLDQNVDMIYHWCQVHLSSSVDDTKHKLIRLGKNLERLCIRKYKSILTQFDHSVISTIFTGTGSQQFKFFRHNLKDSHHQHDWNCEGEKIYTTSLQIEMSRYLSVNLQKASTC